VYIICERHHEENMKIYAQEIADGVSERVKNDTTIAYCSAAVLSNKTESDAVQLLLDKVKASSNPNQIDLYYLKSILVSTGWNKNDDVFDPNQTWAARSTPEDKQFNLMHNENDIIGHITGCYVVDRDGNKVSAEDSETPYEFDIVTEAVIYNSWTNPENRERMQKIISEIEQGKWFVSMECLFAGFDYAVKDNAGKSKVVARNEDSAFLTKHLRAYGGTGEYEGYQIGRLLRDISFSGKGLVSRPANPRSIILDSSKAFSVDEQQTISNVSEGEVNMSDNNEEKQLETAPVVEEAAKVEATEVQVENNVSELEASLVAKETEIQAYASKVTTLEETIANLQKDLAAMDKEMKDMKKKEKDRSRKEKLVMAGFEDSEADESLSLYDALSDEAFEAVVAAMKKKWGAMKDKMMKEEKKEMASETEVVAEEKTEVAEESTAAIFEEVKTTEATLVDASDASDEIEATRASVAEWLTNNVLRK